MHAFRQCIFDVFYWLRGKRARAVVYGYSLNLENLFMYLKNISILYISKYSLQCLS
jgi:hypothetical protein